MLTVLGSAQRDNFHRICLCGRNIAVRRCEKAGAGARVWAPCSVPVPVQTLQQSVNLIAK